MTVGASKDKNETDRFTYALGDLELYDKEGKRIDLPAPQSVTDTGKNSASASVGRKDSAKGNAATANNHQRKNVVSNSHAGREFEAAARLFFDREEIVLEPNFSVAVGYTEKKAHRFDLGSAHPPIIVECKSYTWTETGGSPSAKIRGINEAMLLFSLAPSDYRKILFLLKDVHSRRKISLASHYIGTQGHLIPPDIEVWEFDLPAKTAERLR